MVNPEDITINLYDKVERNVHHYGQNHDLSKWHKEASISTKAFNPFFTSVITFGSSEEDLPLVTYDKEDELLKIQVAYKDGYKEVIEVKRFETIVTR